MAAIVYSPFFDKVFPKLNSMPVDEIFGEEIHDITYEIFNISYTSMRSAELCASSFISFVMRQNHQGLYLPIGKMSYRQMSPSLEVARLGSEL